VQEYGLDLIGMVPEDQEVRDFDLNGKPTVELVNENQAVKAAYEIFEKIFET
jgi:CO dehydrogenase maturation factor